MVEKVEGEIVKVFGKDKTGGGMGKISMGGSRRWKKISLGFWEQTEQGRRMARKEGHGKGGGRNG